MDSRERTFLALNHEEPDRVPIDFWSSRCLDAKLEKALGTSREAFLDANDVDLRYIQGPRYIGPPLAADADGATIDIWGVRRRKVAVELADGGREVYSELKESPLAGAKTAKEIEAYGHWPSPDWFDYAPVADQCRRIREAGRVTVFVGDRMNRVAQLKPAMYLRGMDRILMDMALEPEIAAAILGRIRAFYLVYAERILEAAGGLLDIFLMGDDFGMQQGPLVSPQMWEAFLGDGFGAYAKLARDHGVKVMHHTCGSVAPLIGPMMERGLDILQSLQPEAGGMDLAGLKRDFGDGLAFHGGLSIQRTVPFGTPGDIRREVAERVRVLAPGGGYILCTSHNVQADAPIENVQALLEAYREEGTYARAR